MEERGSKCFGLRALQGGKETVERKLEGLDFDPAGIDTLFLTHAHIDHSGRIPKLVRDGFRGEIITSPPTVELCRIMLLDSAHVQEMEAAWQSKRRARRGRKGVEPLYTMADAEESLKYFRPVERDQMIRLDGTVGARLRTAGHILGASILELFLRDGDREIKVVLSATWEERTSSSLKDPFDFATPTTVSMNPTYGNRLHRNLETARMEFLEAVRLRVSTGRR